MGDIAAILRRNPQPQLIDTDRIGKHLHSLAADGNNLAGAWLQKIKHQHSRRASSRDLIVALMPVVMALALFPSTTTVAPTSGFN